MRAFTLLMAVMLFGSVLAPATTVAEVARSHSRAGQSLADVLRATFQRGSASYLDDAMAAALGLDTTQGPIDIVQQETSVGADRGRLIAVTLRQTRGQNQIVLASWTKGEVTAYLTSPAGTLTKAVRGTTETGWKATSTREAEKEFAAEKAYWLAR